LGEFEWNYSNKIEWNKLLNEFSHECAYCGSKELIMADHIIPQSKDNSTDILYNLVPCCSECNDLKDTKPMKEWLKIREVSNDRIQELRNHWEKFSTDTSKNN
jgi:5-methylcytosine-specific restriction endonuclease McrA